MRFVDPDGMEYGDLPKIWDSFVNGFTKPFTNFTYTISHPIETVSDIVQSFKNASDTDIAMGVGSLILRMPDNPLGMALESTDKINLLVIHLNL